MKPDEPPKRDPPSKTAGGPGALEDLVEAAGVYSRMVSEWFKGSEPALHSKEQEFLAQAGLGAPGVREDIDGITTTVRILRSQQHAIHDALRSGLQNVRETEPAAIESIRQASAGIEQSIAAWLRLKESFPESTDDILNLLVPLDRLRRGLEAEFPSARREER